MPKETSPGGPTTRRYTINVSHVGHDRVVPLSIWSTRSGLPGTAVVGQQTSGRRRDKNGFVASSGSNVKRWIFARHSHPWSAWTRWASTPLVLFPVWNRSARQGVAVAAWLALNPILFPPPRDDSAFATRAILGEERWLGERRLSGALAIDCMAGAALLVAVDSARRRRPGTMTVATIGTMCAVLWYWREMVRFYDTLADGQQSTATGHVRRQRERAT